MKMNRVRKNQRLLAALLLVVMLIPMLAMMAYASAKYPYAVSFGYRLFCCRKHQQRNL